MTVLDDFIADARKIALEDAFTLVGGDRRKANISGEEVGPCPCCHDHGKDRFSINFSKQVWSCRHYDRQGGDALALVAHKEGLDLRRRAEFLEACSLIQGKRPIPEGGERETEDERAERMRRNAAARASAEAKRDQSERDGNDFRAKEIKRARGIYNDAADGEGTAAEAYLCRRIGAKAIPEAIWENLRFRPDLTYWEGKDERGNPRDIHCGPALVAPMVDLDGNITGCHQTWIDLGNGPKFRPDLRDDAGAPLPTKKMRGHKKGSIIPVFGDLAAARWIVGEGIETVLAIAFAEDWRSDTFYAAAGDLGNMAGPADPASAFNHPTRIGVDKRGRKKPERVAGPVPRRGAQDDCFQLPGHVTDLYLITDGDSEIYFTISAMARAEARLSREGLVITHLPRLAGADYSEATAKIFDETAEAA